MATPFHETCKISIGNTYDTCGTLTRAQLASLPADEALTVDEAKAAVQQEADKALPSSRHYEQLSLPLQYV